MTPARFAVVRTTSNSALQALWLGVAVMLPLFGVSFARLDMPLLRIHIPFPFAGLLFVIAVGIIMVLMGDRRLARPLLFPEHRPVLVVLYLFFVWHLFSLTLSDNFAAGLKEVVKLAVSLLCFWGTLTFFPRDRRFLERFLVVSLWSSVLLICFLIYIYAFVFHSVYLGTNLDTQDKFGRAQLAWYMSILFPYAFFFFWEARSKPRGVLPTMVLLIGLLYAQTRGAWLSVMAGLLYVSVFVWRFGRREALRIMASIFGGGMLMVGAGLWVISRYVDITELVVRFIYLYDPMDVAELHSYHVRWAAIKDAISGFMTSPLIGVGVGNTLEFGDRPTHNDIATILLELGVVGIVLFAVIIGMLAKTSGVLRRSPRETMDWLTLGTRGAFVSWIASMMFINVYTSAQFWLFPALFMITARIGSSTTERLARTCAGSRMASAIAGGSGTRRE